MLDLPRWLAYAECHIRGIDPELFFPEDGAIAREVVDACAVCQVRPACLAYGMQREQQQEPGSKRPSRFGVWGGFTPRSRNRLANGQRAEPVFAFNQLQIIRKKRQEHAA